MSNVFKLWVKPRETMREILKKDNSEIGLLLLFMVGPILWLILDYVLTNTITIPGEEPTPLFLYPILFVLYIVGFYLGSWLLSFVGRKVFKAESTAKNARVGIAWTSISGLVFILPVLGFVLLAVGGFFLGKAVTALIPLLVAIGILIYFALLLWMTVVMYNAWAEALGLASAWQVFGIIMTIYFGVLVVLVSLGGILGSIFSQQISGFFMKMAMENAMRSMDAMPMNQNMGGMMDIQGIEGLEGLEGLENLGELDLDGIDFGDIDFDDIDLDHFKDVTQEDVDAFKEAQGN